MGSRTLFKEDPTMASSSAADTKMDVRRRKRPENTGYSLPSLPPPKFRICDQYGDLPLEPTLVPLARALIALDVRLLHRVQNFYKKRAASTNEARKAKAVPSVEECNEIERQWKNVNSGQRQFSQLYLKSNYFVPIWAEGLRIIKEALGSTQNCNKLSGKQSDFRRILSDYDNLAEILKNQMVDTANQGLIEAEVLFSIQERWIRLDETLNWYLNWCNLNIGEDESRVSRVSLTWPEVRNLVRSDDLRTGRNEELIQTQPASKLRNETEAGTTNGPHESYKVSAFILWLGFFSCAVISTAFFAVGYGRSLHLQGTVNDPDFWFLMQATFMQIPGLLISALLERKRGGLPKWRWGLPTVIAGACSIVAIPLYLIVPTEWSSFLSAVAGATQTFMALQFFLF